MAAYDPSAVRDIRYGVTMRGRRGNSGPVQALAQLQATAKSFHGDWWLAPNLITYLRLVLVIVFCALVDRHNLLALITLLLAGATDWADGKVARRWGLESALGRFIDPLADRLTIIAVAVSFAVAGLIPGWLLIPLFLPEAVLGSLALFVPGFGRRVPTTMLGKIRTGLLLVAFPVILLAQPGLLNAPVVDVIGLAILCVGIVGHLGAGIQYGRTLSTRRSQLS